MRLLSILRDPLLLAPLMTAGIIAGWLAYTTMPSKSLSFDTVDKSSNLLQNASFEEWDNGAPTSWTFDDTLGDVNSTRISQENGFVDGSSMRVTVNDYKQGVIDISSAPISVKSGESYFFKAYYETDAQLDLVVEYTMSNGGTRRELLRHYPDYDYPWSSMGGTVSPRDGDTNFKIVMTMSAKGYIELDAAYVTSGEGLDTRGSSKTNELQQSSWTFSTFGQQQAVSAENVSERSIEVSQHSTGQSAWKPLSVSVRPSELLTYEVTYLAAQPTEIGVDYQLSDGTFTYQVIDTLYPVSVPTTIAVPIEVPKNAISMQPSVQIARLGKLTTTNASLSRTKEPVAFDKPRVSITFDDGKLTSYTNGSQLLDLYGYKGTFYINPGLLGAQSYMDNSQVEDLLRRKHQIGSHTDTHIDLTSYSSSSIIAELDRANKAIKKFGVDRIDFASPFGKHDQKVLPLIMERHASHRGTDTDVNTRQNYDTSNLKGLFMRKEVTDNELRQRLDQTISSNGWLILIYHEIEPSSSPFALDRGSLQRHLDIIKKTSIQVQTVEEASQELNTQL